MTELTIVEEFRDLIPSLTDEEFSLLERSIIKEGVREPIIVWGDIIVDGHNRYSIAQKHKIRFKSVKREFDDINSVKLFIIENQLGRRNLSDFTRYELLAAKEEISLSIGKDLMSDGGKGLSESDKPSEPHNTRKIIADEIGWGQTKVGIAKKVKDQASDEVIQKLRKGEISINEAHKEIKDEIKTAEKEKRIVVEKELAVEFDNTNEDVPEVIHGDFYEHCMNNIDSNSIDIIITDPPYPKEYLYLWRQLGEVADKVLKPGGFLVSYSGQYHLPTVMKSLEEHLEYYWTFCLYHTGPSQIVNAKNVMCKWKPILVYQKSPTTKLIRTIPDYVVSGGRDKDKHEWGQSESGVDTLIECFTKPNDLILDPFAGSGTTLSSARKLKRRSIGIEIDEQYINTIKARLV